MTETLSEHDYILPDTDIFEDQSCWFVSTGLPQVFGGLRELSSKDEVPDLRLYRNFVAYLLSVASHRDFFEYEFEDDQPSPTETDRLKMLQYLEFQASFTGLLHIDEIKQIKTGIYQQFLRFFYNTESQPKLPSREELKEKILQWKSEGFTIVGFQGSFDPPTETHLINATDAILLAQEQGLKFKIIFVLDGDELIQRKANSVEKRPRVNIIKRREILEPFWQVAGTCISNVKSQDDWWQYVLEYNELGIDYILLTQKQSLNLKDIIELHSRVITVRGAKKKTILLEEVPKGPTSTDVIKKISPSKSRS